MTSSQAVRPPRHALRSAHGSVRAQLALIRSLTDEIERHLATNPELAASLSEQLVDESEALAHALDDRTP